MTPNVAGIDPSSTVSGYAVLASANALVDCGFLRPHRTRDPLEARVLAMEQDLQRVLDEARPRAVVIETVSPHPMRRHEGGGHGLATYGFAVGILYRRALAWCRSAGVILYAYPPEHWTGRVTKAARQRGLVTEFPQYGALVAKDPGADVADAIGLVQFWFRQEALRHASPV